MDFNFGEAWDTICLIDDAARAWIIYQMDWFISNVQTVVDFTVDQISGIWHWLNDPH